MKYEIEKQHIDLCVEEFESLVNGRQINLIDNDRGDVVVITLSCKQWKEYIKPQKERVKFKINDVGRIKDRKGYFDVIIISLPFVMNGKKMVKIKTMDKSKNVVYFDEYINNIHKIKEVKK